MKPRRYRMWCARVYSGVGVIALISAMWAAAVPAAESSHWFVPLRWWGNVSYDYHWDKAGGDASVARHLVAVNLNASTYVWQPWFVQLNGGLGVALNYSDARTGATTGTIASGHSKLLVLPQSRFPLSLHFERSDSQLSGELVGIKYTDTRYGLVQRYRTPAGGTTLLAGYDHDTYNTANDGEDVSNFARLEMTHHFKDQELKISSRRQKTEHRVSGETYMQDTVIARHSYHPTGTFNAESLASVIDTADDARFMQSTVRYVQLSSYAFWNPSDKPVTITGGARYFALSTDGGVTANPMNSINANAGINYNLTRYTRLTGTATATRVSTAGHQMLVTTQTAGIAYQPAYIYFDRFQYSWNVSGSMKNHSGSEDAGKRLDGQLGHALQRSFPTGPGAVLTASVSQSVSLHFDSAVGVPQRISNSGMLAWQSTRGGHNTSLRLMVSDSRTFAGGSAGGEIFQLANFQLSSSSRLSMNSGLTGNLTIQAVRQVARGVPDTGIHASSSGNLMYRHNQAFGVPRLRFTSDLKLNANVATPLPWVENEGQRSMWENRLDYMVGRLDMRLCVRLSKIEKTYRTSILFQIRRGFGD